ncbi:hypothetical protein E2C01_015720 [Portunus trituberculatus]|uniref:Uncharacterized protein n=1 Tax=Portunus trituberculatus TaxID=210409 RepID=A0A5B7DNR6_PORTR|nr:hypothetical protein [Portunus trituberculatus]
MTFLVEKEEEDKNQSKSDNKEANTAMRTIKRARVLTNNRTKIEDKNENTADKDENNDQEGDKVTSAQRDEEGNN